MAGPSIIDVHMHVYPTKEEGRANVQAYDGWEFGGPANMPPYGKFDGDVEDALAALDEAGASRAAFVHFYPPLMRRHDRIAALPDDLGEAEREGAVGDINRAMADGLRESNLWACGVGRDNPRLLPLISIDPGVMTPEESAAHLRDMAENHGARGVKLHAPLQRFYMGDVRMRPVYEACVDLDLVIVAHSGSTAGLFQYGDPWAFAAVYERFPDLKLVMAHLGNGSWRQTRQVADAYPNAMFDCCELMEWVDRGGGPSEGELAMLMKDVGPERVMLGTDFPWWDPIDCAERIAGLPVLSAEEKEGILGANAERLLGI